MSVEGGPGAADILIRLLKGTRPKSLVRESDEVIPQRVCLLARVVGGERNGKDTKLLELINNPGRRHAYAKYRRRGDDRHCPVQPSR
jgi:hypothetical protein